MARKIRYGKRRCPICGFMVTKNALGHAAHVRNCSAEKAEDRIRRLNEQAREKLRNPFKLSA